MRSAGRLPPGAVMFFFFSNGLGLVGSIVVSIVVTVVLLKACGM
jgi:hypothetical protein